jgi:hypothetical protein
MRAAAPSPPMADHASLAARRRPARHRGGRSVRPVRVARSLAARAARGHRVDRAPGDRHAPIPSQRPPPRRHLVTYHGMLAPAAGLRSRVVPQVAADEAAAADEGVEVVQAERTVQAALALRRCRKVVPHAPQRGLSARAVVPIRRYPWADLLRRVFANDVLRCPHCAGTRRVLAAIHDPDSVRKVLGSLGLSAEVPELAACRAPSGGGAGGEGGDDGVAE